MAVSGSEPKPDVYAPAPKICRNCRHLYTTPRFKQYCTADGAFFGWDLVSGDKKFSLARVVRAEESLCGVSARWFEERT